MDRPCDLLHPGPAAGPLQSTFPQSEPGPRELRAQAPPPSPATGWRRTRPRPESRARRAARNCLLLCCCCATTWLFFFSFFFFKKLLLQIKLSKAPPEADPDLRTPPRGQKVALPAALTHQRIRRCATFQKVNCVWHRRATGVGPIKGFFESSWKCPGLALGTAEFRGGLLFP